MRDNTVKRSLINNEVVCGVMAQEFATPGFPSITANSGAQFVVYDMEHTGWSLETVKMLIAAGRSTSLIPFVRVPTAEYHWIAHVLDIGACGVVIPLVHNAQILERVIESAYYPPIGRRGCSFGLIHDDYQAGDLPAMMQHANENLLLIAQIESQEGVDNIDAISSNPNVHAIWIGGYDLSCSLGSPGDFQSQRYQQCVEQVMASCRKHSKTIVLGTLDAGALAQGAANGYQMLVYTSDLGIYSQALRQCMDAIKMQKTPQS